MLEWLAAAGMASRRVAREIGCARGVASKWRVRFADDRLAGLADRPRSGKPKTYGANAGRRILALLDRPPPQGFARWTAPLLARELGDRQRSARLAFLARPTDRPRRAQGRGSAWPTASAHRVTIGVIRG